MNSNERPQRVRQTVQDLERADVFIELEPDGTACLLEEQKREVEVRLPSRVAGRFRMQSVPETYLAAAATYRNVPELIEARRVQLLSERQKANGSWTLEDIPADVVAQCDAWATQYDDRMAALTDLAHATAQEPVDRMCATRPCPYCEHSDPRYACRTSGWAKELYSYPLVRMQDDETHEVYEVPFDAALYIDEHPTHQFGTAHKEVGSDGQLSAIYDVSIPTDPISADYVRRATNGTIQPKSTLHFAADSPRLNDVRVQLGSWSERPKPPFLYAKPPQTAADTLQALQTSIVIAYAERVSDTDYNEMLRSLQRALGERGLKLAVGWKYCGMGDSEAVLQARSAEHKVVLECKDIDVHDTLLAFTKKFDQAVQ